MSPHLLQLRARRLWRRRVTQSLAVMQASGEFTEKNLLLRLGHLRRVWKFALLWIALMVVLAGGLAAQLSALKSYYQVLQPVPGGRYTEGIAGVFTTANPMYAVSDVDTSVSQLVFSGLLTYNDQNALTGNLAESWSVDPTGKVYTVRLRPSLTWHDGQPLTADDVAFTYRTIQNPDAQSPLYASWHGVTVTVINDRTVTFTLPNPLSSFPSSLTNGIVPKHLLQGINPVDLRSASFNTANPVGSGPFTWGSIGVSGVADTTEAQIDLLPFDHYWAGVPKLASFHVYAFADTNAMVRAYQSQEISAMAGLDHLPASVAKDAMTHVYNLPLSAGVYVFFKTTSPALQDVKVRQALIAGADRKAIMGMLGYPTAAVDEPLLTGQLAYDPAYAQATGDAPAARALLDAAGWKTGADGVRSKDGQRLGFTLAASDSYEYTKVARALRDEWRSLGVNVQLALQPAADFQGTLSSHAYDAALYGVAIGSDPDVFVYWDSSQADIRSENRLNFSEYKSTAADVALEAGRTRLDPQLRTVKYRPFLKAWHDDAPALALYQPRFLYISHEKIHGLSLAMINSDAGRFRNVENWMIHEDWVTR